MVYRRLAKLVNCTQISCSAFPSAQSVAEVLESFAQNKQWLKVAGGQKGCALDVGAWNEGDERGAHLAGMKERIDGM